MTEYELNKKVKLMHSGLSPDNIMQSFEIPPETEFYGADNKFNSYAFVSYNIIKGGLKYEFICNLEDWDALKQAVLRDSQIDEILSE